MNVVVFGLGLFLSAAGCLSIFAGYDIVRVGAGWTEVVAGTTALSGGVLTIAVSMVLRRLKLLSDLLAAAQPYGVAPAPITEAALEPAPAFSIPAPAALAVQAPPAPMSQPIPASAYAAPIPKAGFIRTSFKRAKTTPLSRPLPVIERDDAPAKPTAAFDDYEDRLPFAHDLDQPEPAPAVPQPAPAPSAATLSLDEMWQRVSDEIEKPIFSTSSSVPAIAKASSDTFEPQHIADLSVETPAATLDEPVAPTPLGTPARDEERSLDQQQHVEPDFDAAAVHQPKSLLDVEDISDIAPPEPPAFEWDAGEKPHHSFGERQASTGEAEASLKQPEPAYNPHPPVEPPAVEPAVIGRYEAEGTAYLMFADGSIEAQSEAGIFRFASMAELKAFIESKQVAET